MPVTLVCRRCGSEVAVKDTFCQECGLTQKRPESAQSAVGQGMSDFDWPALEDPSSAAGTADYRVNSLQNETYDFSNYQLDLSEAVSDEALDESKAETALSQNCCKSADLESNSSVQAVESETAICATVDTTCGAAPESQEETKLHSPLFGKDKPIENDLGHRGGSGMVLVNNAVVIAIVGFGLIFSFVGYKMYKDVDAKKNAKAVVSASAIIEKVKDDATKNNYQGVYDKLNELRSQGKTEDFKQQETLFSEAAFRLGEKALEAGDVQKGTEFLNQVPPDSQHFARAKELIMQSVSPTVQENKDAKEKADPSTSTDTKESSQRPVNLGSAEQPPVNTSRPAIRELSERQVLSIPVIPEIEKMNAETGTETSATAGTTESAGGNTIDPNKAVTPPAHKFSESDISQYNRMLAEFLAKKESSSEQSSTEAPSFREWLKTGKPKF